MRRPPCPTRAQRAALTGALLVTSMVSPLPAQVSAKASTEVSGYADSDAVSVLTPAASAEVKSVLEGWSASGSYLVDIVSAASVDIVSTASPHWVEVRHAATLGARYAPGDLAIGLGGSFSVEPDYTSIAAGGNLALDVARKNANLGLGYNYARDEAGRSGTPFSVYSLVLHRHSFTPNANLVLDRETELDLVGDAIFEFGRQEKPYRYLPLFDAATADRVPAGASVELVNQLRLPGKLGEAVPEDRQRYAVSARLARRFAHSTFIASERFYADSWGVVATTGDVRHMLEPSRRLTVWPHLRGHLQRGANFWQRAYVGSLQSGVVTVPRLRSGDRELGPLWTLTLGAGARYDLGSPNPREWAVVLQLDLSYTRYLDALYIDERRSGFAALSLEKSFE